MTRWPAAAGALALLLAGLGCYAATPSPATHAAALPANAESARDDGVRELARRVNARRARQGKGRLIWDEKLARVAQAHSRDMARRGYFSHTNPDGRDPFERLSAAGIRYRAAAENIGEGQRDAEEMLDDWIGSPGHRRNLDNATYTHHGIGSYQRRWTHVFARYAARR